MRGCCRSCWCRRLSSTAAAEAFHRVCRETSAIITACQPDAASAVRVGREIAPRSGERWNRCIYRPSVTDRIIGVHLVGWIGRGSSTAHHEHFAVEVKRPRLSCRPRYGGNRADRIRHRVINKGVGRIGKNASRNIAASTRVDEAADGRGGYVTQRNRQNSGLLYPGSRRSKLPDLAGPLPTTRDGVEPAQDIELVVQDREATGQNHSQATGPGSSNRADHVSDRVVTEYAIESADDGNLRTTHAIDVRRSSVS